LRAINWLYLNGVLPLVHPAQYRGLAGELRKHEAFERKSLAENQEIQWESLIRLLQHAYDTTPFYRRRFDAAGIHPKQISSPSDLQKIPLLTREDLRLFQDDLWSRRYQREVLPAAATGGTTDTPVPLLRSPGALRKKNAVHSRFNTWAAMWPGDKVLYFWGARIDFAQNPSWRWRFYDRYLMRRIWAPTSIFNPEVLESYRQTLNRFRPKIIYGYPTPIALFCEFLSESGRSFHKPVSVISSAEPLLDQHRRIIQGTLQCPIYEFYGSREFGMIGAECERHEGFHLNPQAAYVELLPVKGAEAEGLHEILVTDLLNDGMPLIRYKINDCTRIGPESCPCGRGYPLLQKVIGRTADNFHLPNGDIVPGISLQNRVIKVCPGLRKIQVIQDTLSDFRVRFVPGETFSSDDLKSLQRNLHEYFGGSVRWSFEQVQDIERERSGKTRFCISHVKSPQHSFQVTPQEMRR
jgi:phenylacetate-CoA ligase